MTSIAHLHLYGELSSNKFIELLSYRDTDPFTIRATRLQIFNDLAEGQPDLAIECLKEIQLGLKVSLIK